MNRRLQQLAAASLATVAGLTVVAAAGVLITDAVAARLRTPHEKSVVDDLLKKGEDDAAYAGPLMDEYVRLTTASLARDERVVHFGYVLLLAGAAFLIGAKWFIAIRRTQWPIPQRVLELHAATLAEPPVNTAPAARHLPIFEDIDLVAVDDAVATHGRTPDAAIPILHALQAYYRYLPRAALRRVCELTEITPAQLAGVASFYTQFRHTPIGEHLVTVCHGTACHVAGAPRITDELRRSLGIAADDDTDADQQFTIEQVPCLGCCTLAPVVQIDGVTHGHARPDTLAPLLDECRAGRDGDATPMELAAPGNGQPAAGEIRLGMGSCCIANGSGRVHDALERALASVDTPVAVKRVGCVGMCHQTPFIEITTPDGTSALYSQVQPEHAAAIVQRHFQPRGLARRTRQTITTALTTLRNGTAQQAARQHAIELRDPPVAAFLGRQKHIATEHYGRLDPLDLDEYLAHDGFAALEICLDRIVIPEQIIAQIKASGLRGRGGAGFPTWQKWTKVRNAAGEPKYLICNGDEGDPGAFMDRMLMESYPYRIIEGAAIAAYATGATEGIFYIRAEYPLAVERIRTAIERCEQRGIVGDTLLGRARPLHLRVVQGAGAFVCGEETALLASIMGQRGTPTLRPPYPAEQGLWGCPTLVNNVETYAVVPWIVRNGPDSFAGIGTETSKGTKVFALTGKIRRGGLIEVPMGVTIREIVEDIGGGIKDEPSAAGPRPHTFKAVQIGGPSGGCVPAAMADTPVDFEALTRVGAMMGSGGLVVLDETDCMVDIARYFLTFTQDQSCGKCVPCRIGTKRMLEILERICAGQGYPADLDELEHLAVSVQGTSLCGLGKTAPNPVLTTLRYFRDEYEAHLAGRCPAGRCKALIRYQVTDACTGCTLCAQHCPAGAIALRPYERHEIDPDKCTRCDVCRTGCPEAAIRIE